MKTIKSYFVVFILMLVGSAFAQVGKWQNYTTMKSVNKIAITNDGIWAATNGGAFFYSFKDKSYLQFTTTEGLKSINVTAIAVDHKGRVWFGSSNGNIDVYDPISKKWEYIVAIANSEKTKKRINGLVSSDTLIYACTDFGVSIIYSTNMIFGDTYNKLGSFGTDLKVNTVYEEDTLWVASEKGIAVQKSGLINYLTPESWWNFSTSQGLPTQNVSSLIRYKDTLYAGTSAGLAIFSNGIFSRKTGPLLTANIIDMVQKGDSLIITSQNEVYSYYQGKYEILFSTFSEQVTDLSTTNDKNEFYPASTVGILERNGTDLKFIFPSGPNSNLFPSIAVDENGNLWATSGKDIVSKGFYRLSESGWKNYLANEYPQMGSNAYHKTKVTSNNTIWMLGWGYGVLRIKNDSSFVRFYDKNVDSLVGIAGAKEFIVISGVAEDSKNNIWILNRDAGNQKILAVLSSDSSWKFYQNGVSAGATLLDDIVIDKYDTKWMITATSTQSPINQGVYYFNENGTLSKTWGFISTSNGLNGAPTSIAVDLRDEIWVGTNLGANIILDPTRPEQKISSVYTLRQQYINCVTVDGLNNKWVGTRTGVWVLSPDGTSLIAQYNTKNSPLLSDDIKSIAINNKNGLVYIGTDNGLSSLYTMSVKPSDSFDKLLLYPNPLIIEDSKTVKLTIDGLIKNSYIKVVSVDGNVINEFSTPGGRVAFWDGKDNQAKYVSSGVYFIIAHSEDGEQVVTGKVAVINR